MTNCLNICYAFGNAENKTDLCYYFHRLPKNPETPKWGAIGFSNCHKFPSTLTFCDLWTLLKRIKLTSYKCTFNSDLEIQVQHFVGGGGERHIQILPKLGEQNRNMGVTVFWVCPTISLGKQSKVAVSTFPSLTQIVLLVIKQKQKTQTFCVMLCLHIWNGPYTTLQPRSHIAGRMIWKTKVDCIQPLLGLNWLWAEI